MTGHENKASLFRACCGPLKVIFRMHWLIVFVNTNEGHIDVEAWEVKVVRVSTEERGLKFWNENQTNVGIFLVTIKIVLSALVKRDDIGTQAGVFQRLRFDCRDLSAS